MPSYPPRPNTVGIPFYPAETSTAISERRHTACETPVSHQGSTSSSGRNLRLLHVIFTRRWERLALSRASTSFVRRQHVTLSRVRDRLSGGIGGGVLEALCFAYKGRLRRVLGVLCGCFFGIVGGHDGIETKGVIVGGRGHNRVCVKNTVSVNMSLQVRE